MQNTVTASAHSQYGNPTNTRLLTRATIWRMAANAGTPIHSDTQSKSGKCLRLGLNRLTSVSGRRYMLRKSCHYLVLNIRKCTGDMTGELLANNGDVVRVLVESVPEHVLDAHELDSPKFSIY